MFKNDVSYILINKRKLFILYYVAICFVSIMYASSGMGDNRSLSIILGNNYRLGESLYIELIMYILNVAVAIYLCFLLYIKDIRYQLDNIFLRISPKAWIIKKNFIFLIVMAVFKAVEYVLIILMFYISKKGVDVYIIFPLIFKDYIYHLVIQYFLLFTYVVFELLKGTRPFFIVLSLLAICLFPKNISTCNLLLLIILLIGIILFIIMLFINKSKLIIQKVGKL